MDPLRTQLPVDVRVVNNLSSQVDLAIGKTVAGLVRVVDRTVYAIAKAELVRQMDGQTARCVTESGILDRIDEIAVVALRERISDLVLHVEALAEDQLRHCSLLRTG